MRHAVLAVALFAVFVCAVAAALDLEAIARTVTEELVAGSHDKVVGRFDPTMAAALPKEKLSQAWAGVIGQVGPFKSITTVKVQDVPGQPVHVALVTCAFEHASVLIQIAFRDDATIAGLFLRPAPTPAAWAPPAYVDPATFSERDVAVGGFKLPGTLSMPNGGGPYAAAVLVQGSGPSDRDETVGATRVFRDLAEGLASRRIAVLRYDKRTAVAGTGTIATVKDEVLDDVKGAMTMLSGDPKVDRGKIFVVGHSLGGTLAPRIAAGDPRVAGIVVLAGASRPLETVALDQVSYLTGSKSPQTAAAEASARMIRSPDLTADATVTFLGASTPGSYWLDLRAYHPVQTAASLAIPMMLLQGGRDYQVTPLDLEGWKKTLEGRPNVTFKSYPEMNHLFMAGTGPSLPDEYMRPGHVDAQVVGDIAGWITSRAEPR